MKKIGILAFHGDVIEHTEATKQAAANLHLDVEVIPVRSVDSIKQIDALILPGGESTTLYKLCERAKIWEKMKQINYIFGTCAGAIMLAKVVRHKMFDQKSLELMDIEIDRNAYGRQTDSFEKDVNTKLGPTHAIFIRAPKIGKVGKSVTILGKYNNQIIACEERVGEKYYLAVCFHPELSSPLFHEYFLRKVYLFLS